MPALALHSAAQFTLEELVDIFAAGFEGYMVPLVQPLPALAARIRAEQIDLHLSRVIVADDDPAGLCLLALRGRRVRVAAMGIAARWRGRGLGRALIDGAIDTARAAGANRMLLEVIATNHAAFALYESAGFAATRRLVGYARGPLEPRADGEHRVADVEELAAAMAAEPEQAWPWQLSPHTLVSTAKPIEVHALAGDAYACVNRTDPLRLAVRLLYVRPPARRHGCARRLLGAVQSLHPQAAWDIPAVIPEELGGAALVALGFARTELSQLEMERRLAP
jgi:GNAT superfamily N-acetyltransferase